MKLTKSYSESYKDAGVDIEAGYEAVNLMRRHVNRTIRAGVLSGIGGFGGLFELDTSAIPHPVLVSGTDGVGTKLRIAFLLDRHNTVGIDCVAMCVNDVVCCGAEPLVFLDYIACGKNTPAKIAAIVEGVAEGCVQAGAALIGGETAEMPGFYPSDEYDLAGFAVGAVDKAKIFDNTTMRPGDVVLALPSSGVHSNGFSLVRKVFDLDNPATAKNTLADYATVLGRPLGDVLLEPTRIYVKAVLAVAGVVPVLGVSHITGGGFFENIPRCLPDGLTARIEKARVKTPPIFPLIAEQGAINEHDMFNTFNMGVGMTCVVHAADADTAITALKANGVSAYPIGEIIKSDNDNSKGVELT
jgi:phosphoribosylformylglycinamidine cyclo-ligase